MWHPVTLHIPTPPVGTMKVFASLAEFVSEKSPCLRVKRHVTAINPSACVDSTMKFLGGFSRTCVHLRVFLWQKCPIMVAKEPGLCIYNILYCILRIYVYTLYYVMCCLFMAGIKAISGWWCLRHFAPNMHTFFLLKSNLSGRCCWCSYWYTNVCLPCKNLVHWLQI